MDSITANVMIDAEIVTVLGHLASAVSYVEQSNVPSDTKNKIDTILRNAVVEVSRLLTTSQATTTHSTLDEKHGDSKCDMLCAVECPHRSDVSAMAQMASVDVKSSVTCDTLVETHVDAICTSVAYDTKEGRAAINAFPKWVADMICNPIVTMNSLQMMPLDDFCNKCIDQRDDLFFTISGRERLFDLVDQVVNTRGLMSDICGGLRCDSLVYTCHSRAIFASAWSASDSTGVFARHKHRDFVRDFVVRKLVAYFIIDIVKTTEAANVSIANLNPLNVLNMICQKQFYPIAHEFCRLALNNMAMAKRMFDEVQDAICVLRAMAVDVDGKRIDPTCLESLEFGTLYRLQNKFQRPVGGVENRSLYSEVVTLARRKIFDAVGIDAPIQTAIHDETLAADIEGYIPMALHQSIETLDNFALYIRETTNTTVGCC